MKKLTALIIAAITILSLASCGGSTSDSVETNPTGTQGNSGIIAESDIEALETVDDLIDSLKPDGWDENLYGMYIYDVWDSDFLPDVMPRKD